jgi:hypothetical protein
VADPIITLTTDFGEDSPYVAAVKGAILTVNPAARILDLSHQIPAQDLHHAAFFLAEAIPFFPPGVIHVVIVDPGVGTERNLISVELGPHRILSPDNGVLTLLLRKWPLERAVRLAEPRYWRETVSATFHGRDILAPVAAHLSLGLDPAQLGPPVSTVVELPIPQPAIDSSGVRGQVVFVDHFGNLITNIPSHLVPSPFTTEVTIQGQQPRWVRTYGEAEPGTLVALFSSGGWLEIAMVQGNAAQSLGCGRGAACQLSVAGQACK